MNRVQKCISCNLFLLSNDDNIISLTRSILNADNGSEFDANSQEPKFALYFLRYSLPNSIDQRVVVTLFILISQPVDHASKLVTATSPMQSVEDVSLVLATHGGKDNLRSKVFPEFIAGRAGSISEMLIPQDCGHMPPKKKTDGVISAIKNFYTETPCNQNCIIKI